MSKYQKILISIAAIMGLAIGVASAGTGTVSDAVPGTTILASDFNKITGALKVISSQETRQA